MSELKAFRIIQGDTGGYGAPSYKCDTDGNRLEEWGDICEVYEKYEADEVIAEKDKVIANKDYEIDELKKSIVKLLKSKTEQVMDEVLRKCLIYGEGFVPVEHAMRIIAELRHHKYKRCLAMARIAQDNWHLHNSFYAMGHQEFEKRKCEFYEKWRKRWLELAEKFKEAK